MNRTHFSSTRLLGLLAAAVFAVGCASAGRSTTTTTSAGEVEPATNSIGGTVPTASADTGANVPVGAATSGPGVTGAPVPGSPGAATQQVMDSARTGAGVTGAVGALTTGMAGGASMGARSDAHIVGLLHESNVGEITAGNLAQQRAQNAATRDFAKQMVNEHTALDLRGSTLGAAPALPDSALPQLQQQELTQLQQATGAAFDRAYLTQQVAAHQRTLALVDAAIPLAQDASVRTMLQNEVRPRVASHLQKAQDLLRQVGSAP